MDNCMVTVVQLGTTPVREPLIYRVMLIFTWVRELLALITLEPSLNLMDQLTGAMNPTLVLLSTIQAQLMLRKEP